MFAKFRSLSLALGLALALGFCQSADAAGPGCSACRGDDRARVDAPTVHLIAIGDSNARGNSPDFGRKLKEDAENIVRTFEDSFRAAGRTNQLSARMLLGDDVTPENVLSAIDNLKIKENDALVVLYSGHGGTERGGRHLLTLHSGHLPRETLLAAMKAKNARLSVLLTDACSGYPQSCTDCRVPAYVPAPTPRAIAGGETMEWNTVSDLFLAHAGLVDITAAEVGYNARCDNFVAGSVFTNALVKVLKSPHRNLVQGLDGDRDGRLQWDEILPQVRDLGAERDRQHGESQPQRASATSLGRWMPTTPTTTVAR